MSDQGQCFQFGRFSVDAAQRRLTRDGQPVEVNSRYLDALVLLLNHPGELISRERFLDEVWNGVPVTDEALSQCIANLRRLLEDNAGRPKFIETVPKHGYRFIAPVEVREPGRRGGAKTIAQGKWPRLVALVLAGAIGGGLAGVVLGLVYGLAASPDPLGPAVGAASFLLVMLSVNILAGVIGGFAVGLGIATAHGLAGRTMLHTAAGAALGGLVVGTLAKMLGVDAFTILLGRAPAALPGGLEGLVLGGAVGLGTHLSLVRRHPWPGIAGSALAGAIAGALLPTFGGRLMGASLDALAAAFPGSPLNIDRLGGWFGEAHFGHASQIAFGAIEGLLFGAGIAFAIRYARSTLRELGLG